MPTNLTRGSDFQPEAALMKMLEDRCGIVLSDEEAELLALYADTREIRNGAHLLLNILHDWFLWVLPQRAGMEHPDNMENSEK